MTRVLEPPTLHLLLASAGATLTVAAVEGTLLCQDWPLWESLDAAQFVLRYSIEQLFPSVVWETQPASLVATALGYPPDVLLRDLSGTTPASASLVLQTNLLATSRHFFAGYMMIAQLVRAASVSIGSLQDYQERIRLGTEPPLMWENGGLVVRLCGLRSHVSEVSLQRMGTHLLPVLEDPAAVQYLVQKHSFQYRSPVYWWVAPDAYGNSFSWNGFPVDKSCFLQGLGRDDHILVLEADATNGNDPLSLGKAALDLTLDDASQGFRRIVDKYTQQGWIPKTTGTTASTSGETTFRMLRVYLGNSLELQTTGGGHSYTIRHRIQYAKEVDVLLDSRAPVLERILQWCESVASKDRKIFFQTSSKTYFWNQKTLLREYGFEIYDPLDLRMLHHSQQQQQQQYHPQDTPSQLDEQDKSRLSNNNSFLGVLLKDREFVSESWEEYGSFLQQFTDQPSPLLLPPPPPADQKESPSSLLIKDKKEMLREVARLSKLPRLVHMRTTAETVNAVEALVMAGEIETSNCCALMDRQEGVEALERTLRRETGFVQQSQKPHQWTRREEELAGDDDDDDDDNDNDGDSASKKQAIGGLEIICSSSIHDDLFRQVRQWARMGHSASAIQAEFDARYKGILAQSHSAEQKVRQVESSSSKQQERDPKDKPKRTGNPPHAPDGGGPS